MDARFTDTHQLEFIEQHLNIKRQLDTIPHNLRDNLCKQTPILSDFKNKLFQAFYNSTEVPFYVFDLPFILVT